MHDICICLLTEPLSSLLVTRLIITYNKPITILCLKGATVQKCFKTFCNICTEVDVLMPPSRLPCFTVFHILQHLTNDNFILPQNWMSKTYFETEKIIPKKVFICLSCCHHNDLSTHQNCCVSYLHSKQQWAVPLLRHCSAHLCRHLNMDLPGYSSLLADIDSCTAELSGFILHTYLLS